MIFFSSSRFRNFCGPVFKICSHIFMIFEVELKWLFWSRGYRKGNEEAINFAACNFFALIVFSFRFFFHMQLFDFNFYCFFTLYIGFFFDWFSQSFHYPVLVWFLLSWWFLLRLVELFQDLSGYVFLAIQVIWIVFVCCLFRSVHFFVFSCQWEVMLEWWF